MQVFDVSTINPGASERPANQVFFDSPAFSARVVALPPGGRMPDCEMSSYVLFFVLDGVVEVTADGESADLAAGQCLVSEPATLSMSSEAGARIMGIQVVKTA